jgi:hypothetical protein
MRTTGGGFDDASHSRFLLADPVGVSKEGQAPVLFVRQTQSHCHFSMVSL